MRQEFSKAVKMTIQNEMLSRLHTAIPGRIIEYNAEEGIATVQPVAVTYFNGVETPYPPLYDVPVVFPRFGAIELTGPLDANDEVLIIFAERSLRDWEGAQGFPEVSAFSMNNAIALPGFLYGAGSNAMKAQTNKSLILKNGDVELELTGSNLKIKGDIVIDGTVTYVNG